MRSNIRFSNHVTATAAIDVSAPPSAVARVYRDVDRWHLTFPATIEHAEVVDAGETWLLVQVWHRTEGVVANTLIVVSEEEVILEENKKRFDALFLNRFLPAAGGGTHYAIDAAIELKGVYRLLRPLLEGYVRRRALGRVNRYVLEPLKRAAEASVDAKPVEPERRVA